MPGELEIISRIRALARSPIGEQSGVKVGIGDDAAVLETGGARDWLACTDLMVEGVHFRREWSPPRLLGRKALAVTLSDIAAMGGIPRYAMVSVALPHTLTPGFIEQFFDGLLEYAAAEGVAIIGGDTSSSADSLFIDTIGLGDCEAGKAVRRCGARAGDIIYVTGSLGASAAGLALLERGYRIEEGEVDGRARAEAVTKHLSPDPHLGLARAIGERGLATSMIDVSDGLSTDLMHLLEESGCGALVRAEAVPVAGAAEVLADDLGSRPLTLALSSGEEYELLFTARNEDQVRIRELATEFDTSITAVGEVLSGRGIVLERDGAQETLKASGFEHRI